VEAIRNALSDLRDALAFVPDPLAGLLILALAALVALSLHRSLLRLVRRLLRDRHPYVSSFLAGTRDITRLALLILALVIALPATSLQPDTRAVIAKILLLAGIAVVGWAAIVAVNMTADFYLRRFRYDVGDTLLARKHLTQVRVLTRAANTLLVMVTVGVALMTFESVRQYGVSLFASAGIAGLVAGLAARPVLSNLIAGVQIATTQPMRIGDGVTIENEFGNVEEITSTYVVLRLWDLRRMIVPLTYFIEKPFQNWTREAAGVTGAVLLQVDYTTPVERVRQKAVEIVGASKFWDGKVVKLQVTDAKDSTMELRVLASAASSGDAFELRCEIREKLIDFLQREIPLALPRARSETVAPQASAAASDDPRQPSSPQAH
jgi:small-conductance mechanosensitive channel